MQMLLIIEVSENMRWVKLLQFIFFIPIYIEVNERSTGY